MKSDPSVHLKKEYTTDLRTACVHLHHQEGLTVREISDLKRISTRTVQRYLKAHKENEVEFFRKKQMGRVPLASKINFNQYLEKTPQDFGYLFSEWQPAMLSQETKVSYATCRRLLKNNQKNLRGCKETGESKNTNVRWAVHFFKFGNNSGKETLKIDYVNDLYCFVALDLNYYDKIEHEDLSEDNNDESFADPDPFYLKIKTISRGRPHTQEWKENFQRVYSSFLNQTVHFIYNNYGRNPKIFFQYNTTNRSTLPTFRLRKRHGYSDFFPSAQAFFFDPNDQTFFKDMKKLNGLLEKRLNELTFIDNKSLTSLKRCSTAWLMSLK